MGPYKQQRSSDLWFVLAAVLRVVLLCSASGWVKRSNSAPRGHEADQSNGLSVCSTVLWEYGSQRPTVSSSGVLERWAEHRAYQVVCAGTKR